jgi:hypothetical protein
MPPVGFSPYVDGGDGGDSDVVKHVPYRSSVPVAYRTGRLHWYYLPVLVSYCPSSKETTS